MNYSQSSSASTPTSSRKKGGFFNSSFLKPKATSRGNSARNSYEEFSFEAKVHLLVTEHNKNHVSAEAFIKLIGLEFQCFHSSKDSKPFLSFQVSHYVTLTPELDPFLLVLKRSSRPSAQLFCPLLSIVVAFQERTTKVEWEKGIAQVLKKNEAAYTIQRLWKTRNMKDRLHRFVLYAVARSKQIAMIEETSNEHFEWTTRNAAATTIQSSWRSYCVRKQWKKVITFRSEQIKEESLLNRDLPEIDFQTVNNDDTAKMVIFNKKGKGTLGKKALQNFVISARIEKLVDILCREPKESTFELIFLNTLPNFSSPFEVVQLLRMFMKTGGPGMVEKATELLVKWVTTYPQDFNSEAMESKLSEVFLMVKKGMGKEKVDMILKVIGAYTVRKRPEHSFTFDPEGMLPVVLKVEEPKGLLDLDELEVARQLCLISFSIFTSIQPREFCNLAWEKKGKERKAPNILHFIDRSNKLTSWVCQNVMDSPTIEDSVAVIESLIKVCDHLRNYNNFSDLMAIMTGLMHSSISRLKKRWEKVSPPQMKTFSALQEIVSLDKNYSALRSATKKAPPPNIPFIGIWMQDLVFMEENPTKTKDGQINFEKMEMISDIIEKVKRCGKGRYNLMPVPAIQRLLCPETILHDKILFEKSLAVEPRVLLSSLSPTSSPPVPHMRARASSISIATEKSLSFFRQEPNNRLTSG